MSVGHAVMAGAAQERVEWPLHRCTLRGTVDVALAHAPLALVGALARQRIRRAADELPAVLTDCVYLECRLASTDRVDLSCGVRREVRERLLDWLALVVRGSDDPAWRTVHALVCAWADPTQMLNAVVQRVWLEFDLPDSRRADGATRPPLPAPGLFVELVPDACATPQTTRALLRELLTPLCDPMRREAAVLGAARALARRSVEARPAYLGVLPGRAGAVIRACLLGPATALQGYLQTSDGADSCFERVRAETPRCVLDVDIDGQGRLLPRVGLEIPFDRALQVRGDVGERELMRSLVASGLCARTRSRALLAWPGCERRTMPHELWPSLVLRRVNHVKLVRVHGRVLEAKAYLCLTHAFHHANAASIE
jgi:hypothetical protein